MSQLSHHKVSST